MDEDYGAATFAEFAANRLGVEFDAADFSRADFTEAERRPATRPCGWCPRKIQEAMTRTSRRRRSEGLELAGNGQPVKQPLGPEDDRRQLKQIGREELPQFLIEKAEQAIEEIDLSGGQQYLEPGAGPPLDLRLGQTQIPAQGDAGEPWPARAGPSEIKSDSAPPIPLVRRNQSISSAGQ